MYTYCGRRQTHLWRSALILCMEFCTTCSVAAAESPRSRQHLLLPTCRHNCLSYYIQYISCEARLSLSWHDETREMEPCRPASQPAERLHCACPMEWPCQEEQPATSNPSPIDYDRCQRHSTRGPMTVTCSLLTCSRATCNLEPDSISHGAADEFQA